MEDNFHPRKSIKELQELLDFGTLTTSQRVVIEAMIPAIRTLWTGGSGGEAGEYLDRCQFADYSLHDSDLDSSSEADEANGND